MSNLNRIEILRLQSAFLERNKDLVEAIRDKQPRSVVTSILNELKRLCQAIGEQEMYYALRN